jgi:predicted transcriptional regulator
MGSDWAKGATGKKLSSKLSRSISLLRSHGLLRKLPKQHKYVLTDKGRKITTALNALLAASTEDLVKLAA